ncbi:MAG: hypothetical protein ACW99A_19270 [Candidatus Kariarchaeaceae archaeon]
MSKKGLSSKILLVFIIGFALLISTITIPPHSGEIRTKLSAIEFSRTFLGNSSKNTTIIEIKANVEIWNDLLIPKVLILPDTCGFQLVMKNMGEQTTKKINYLLEPNGCGDAFTTFYFDPGISTKVIIISFAYSNESSILADEYELFFGQSSTRSSYGIFYKSNLKIYDESTVNYTVVNHSLPSNWGEYSFNPLVYLKYVLQDKLLNFLIILVILIGFTIILIKYAN